MLCMNCKNATDEKIDVKKIPVPFKIYADFESVESYKGPYLKKYQDHNLCSFGYKYLCNKCHDVLMSAYELNLKGVDFRCISRDETVNKLNNSMLGEKGLF